MEISARERLYLVNEKNPLTACILQVGVLGINFKTADLAIREKFAKAAQAISGERGLFFPHSTVVLSTCNRTEIYFSSYELAEAHSHLLSFFRQQIDEPFEQRLYSYFGIDCFAHLCKVTAGLDSAVVAETEIQRQVKLAYMRTHAIAHLPSCLHYLFQKSLRVGKLLRGKVRFLGYAPSLYQSLFEIATQEWGGLNGKKILLVGYSEIHRGLASFLSHKGIDQVVFCTRWTENTEPGTSVLSRSELENWANYDVISCASISDEYLVKGKGKGKHVIFDLSVPRNVDPELGSQEGISLFNMEQIDRRIQERRLACQEKGDDVEKILWECVTRFARLYREKWEKARFLVRA